MNSVDPGQRTVGTGDQQGQSRGNKAPRRSTRLAWLALGGVAIVLAVGGSATHRLWLPGLQAVLAGANQGTEGGEVAGQGEDPHAGHAYADEAAGGNADDSALEVSPQGRKNIGLTLETVALSDFQKTITIPATLVERPGQSRIVVSAPMTGTVTSIHPIRGEAVAPGTPLFDLSDDSRRPRREAKFVSSRTGRTGRRQAGGQAT